jgi:hypothetical protein
MGKRDGQQKGPQGHAEGQHGERTHARFLEQIQQPMHRGDEDASAPNVVRSDEGRHRLDEDGQQHDDADNNSEFNRQRR